MTQTASSSIVIEEFTGNLFCGASTSAIDAIDVDATIREYHRQVQASLPQYGITWESHNGEGPAERVYGPNGRSEAAEEDVSYVTEEVFNLGTFWVTK